MSWKLVILCRVAGLHRHISLINAHLCVCMRVTVWRWRLYDLMNPNTTMWGVQQEVSSHTPQPNPSESTVVVKNKHCDTKLRVKTGGDHRETHHNFSDALGSSEISQNRLVCVFQAFKTHVKLLIFIKDAFPKPTPTSFSPAEVLIRKRALTCSTVDSNLIPTRKALEINSYLLIKLKFESWRFPFSLAQCVEVFGWPWRSGALPLDPPTEHEHGLCPIAIGSKGGAACHGPAPQPLKQNYIIGTSGGRGLRCGRSARMTSWMHFECTICSSERFVNESVFF